jgi:hypothetical protein
MKRIWPIVLVALAVTSAESAALAPDASIHDLSNAAVLVLHHGVNAVRNFDFEGHDAQIVYAWRENFNAHGYGVYSVLMLRPETKDDWTLVTFDSHRSGTSGGEQHDTLIDSPFDDEQNVASVRFLKGEWHGKRTAMVVTAERDLSKVKSYSDPSPVEFSIYTLAANKGEEVGWPFYYFSLAEHFASDRPYCNSDLALSRAFGLPLPGDYGGLKNADGCIR